MEYGYSVNEGNGMEVKGRRGRPKGLCKVKKIPKIKKKLGYSSPHPIFFFGNPSLTLTEHSNHNNQQLLAMYIYRQNTTPNISTGLGLFWDDFPKK